MTTPKGDASTRDTPGHVPQAPAVGARCSACRCCSRSCSGITTSRCAPGRSRRWSCACCRWRSGASSWRRRRRREQRFQSVLSRRGLSSSASWCGLRRQSRPREQAAARVARSTGRRPARAESPSRQALLVEKEAKPAKPPSRRARATPSPSRPGAITSSRSRTWRRSSRRLAGGPRAAQGAQGRAVRPPLVGVERASRARPRAGGRRAASPPEQHERRKNHVVVRFDPSTSTVRRAA